MIKFKAWNASNSKAIAKFHNMGIGHFGHNAFIHELIRGSLGIFISDRCCEDYVISSSISLDYKYKLRVDGSF